MTREQRDADPTVILDMDTFVPLGRGRLGVRLDHHAVHFDELLLHEWVNVFPKVTHELTSD